jgi:hypothetical protein
MVVHFGSCTISVWAVKNKKYFPCLRHKAVWGEVNVKLHSFLTSGLDGDEGQHHAPNDLTPGKDPGALWIADRVSLRQTLDGFREKKNSLHELGLETRIVQPAA